MGDLPRWRKREVVCEIFGSDGVKRERRGVKRARRARAEVEEAERLKKHGWRKRYRKNWKEKIGGSKE